MPEEEVNRVSPASLLLDAIAENIPRLVANCEGRAYHDVGRSKRSLRGVMVGDWLDAMIREAIDNPRPRLVGVNLDLSDGDRVVVVVQEHPRCGQVGTVHAQRSTNRRRIFVTFDDGCSINLKATTAYVEKVAGSDSPDSGRVPSAGQDIRGMGGNDAA